MGVPKWTFRLALLTNYCWYKAQISWAGLACDHLNICNLKKVNLRQMWKSALTLNFDQKCQFLRKRLVEFSFRFQNWIPELILHIIRYQDDSNEAQNARKGVFWWNLQFFVRAPFQHRFSACTNWFFGRFCFKWCQNAQETILHQIRWSPKKSETSPFFHPCITHL